MRESNLIAKCDRLLLQSASCIAKCYILSLQSMASITTRLYYEVHEEWQRVTLITKQNVALVRKQQIMNWENQSKYLSIA